MHSRSGAPFAWVPWNQSILRKWFSNPSSIFEKKMERKKALF